MSITSYYVEFAKSGRSKCKKCKEPIEKDTIRMMVEVEGSANYTMSSSYHTSCFAIPKAYKDQSATYFVQNVVQDKSIHNNANGKGPSVLPEHENEIIAALEMASSKSSHKKRKSVDGGGGGGGGGTTSNDATTVTTNPITQLKRAYQERCASNTKTATKTATKKAKGRGDTNDDDKSDHPQSAVENIINHQSIARRPDKKGTSSSATTNFDMIDWYGMYHKYTIEELKDVLRYNRQYMTGTKDVLLYKVMDGCCFNGRITFCPVCTTGKLKLVFTPDHNDSTTLVATIQCNGTFDEMSQRRIDCSYTCLPSTAVRHTPFYQNKPSDNDNEIMDAYEEAIKNGTSSNTASGSGGGGRSSSSSSKTQMIELWLQMAESRKLEWNLSSRDGIRKATRGLIEILLSNSNNESDDGVIDVDSDTDTLRLDIPTDIDDAIQSIGPFIATNRDMSISDMIQALIQQYGWYSDKIQKQQLKHNTMTQMVQHPANTELVLALQELSELYFKTGSSNAGICYRKVASAIQAISYAITSENAKQLGSGKNKVANIGKASADKVYEFVTTGTIQKLLEKRAEAA